MDEKFWVLVSFVVFMMLIWRPIGRFLATALDKRSNQIREELDNAVKLREEAQALLASFQRKQRDALKEAEDIVNRAKSESEQMLQEAEKQLEQTLNGRIQQAMEKITQAEKAVVEEVKAHAVDIAVSASQSLIKQHLDKGASDSMFESALRDIRKKLH